VALLAVYTATGLADPKIQGWVIILVPIMMLKVWCLPLLYWAALFILVLTGRYGGYLAVIVLALAASAGVVVAVEHLNLLYGGLGGHPVPYSLAESKLSDRFAENQKASILLIIPGWLGLVVGLAIDRGLRSRG